MGNVYPWCAGVGGERQIITHGSRGSGNLAMLTPGVREEPARPYRSAKEENSEESIQVELWVFFLVFLFFSERGCGPQLSVQFGGEVKRGSVVCVLSNVVS